MKRCRVRSIERPVSWPADAPFQWPTAWQALWLWLAIVVGLAATLSAQDPAAERLFREAERLKASSSYEAALEEYRLIAQQFPQDALASKALLASAELLLSSGDRLSAQALVERLLQDYARTPEAASAFLIRGELEVSEARLAVALQDARSTFRRIPILYGPDRFPALEARSRALVRSGELSLLLGEASAAERDFLTVIEDEAPGPSTSRAYLNLARVWLNQGEWISAADLLQTLINAEASIGRPQDRQRAQNLLDLMHRRLLNPQAGLGHFQRSGRISVPGLSLREPVGVAASIDNEILVIDRKLPTVAWIDPELQIKARRSVDDVLRPGWSAGDQPYVSTANGVWMLFSGQQFDLVDPNKNAPLKGVEAVVQGPLGEWFVVAKGYKSLLRFETPRKGWVNLLSQGKPDLVDLAVDPMGRILALDRKASEIIRVSPDRRNIDVAVRGDWKRPVAMSADTLGFIYVLDRGERRLHLHDPNGQRVASLGPALGEGVELRSPEDLAVDGSGRVWIVDAKLPFLVRVD